MLSAWEWEVGGSRGRGRRPGRDVVVTPQVEVVILVVIGRDSGLLVVTTVTTNHDLITTLTQGHTGASWVDVHMVMTWTPHGHSAATLDTVPDGCPRGMHRYVDASEIRQPPPRRRSQGRKIRPEIRQGPTVDQGMVIA